MDAWSYLQRGAKIDTQNGSAALAQFTRMWSANVTRIIEKNGSWPGFSYTVDEQRRMLRIAEEVPPDQLRTFFYINAIITIPIFIPFVLLMTRGLLGEYGSDFSKMSEAVFFISLGLTCASAIGIGVPLGMFISSWIMCKISPTSSSNLPDPLFARQLFAKMTFQVIRMAVIISFLMIPIWIFVPENSKIAVFVRLIVPILGPLVLIMTFFYYYSDRLNSRA